MTTTKTTPAPTGRYVGRCRSCRVVIIREALSGSWGQMTTTCACGYRQNIKPVIGRTTDHKCGAKCTSALGPTCDCECGGARHGEDHK